VHFSNRVAWGIENVQVSRVIDIGRQHRSRFQSLLLFSACNRQMARSANLSRQPAHTRECFSSSSGSRSICNRAWWPWSFPPPWWWGPAETPGEVLERVSSTLLHKPIGADLGHLPLWLQCLLFAPIENGGSGHRFVALDTRHRREDRCWLPEYFEVRAQYRKRFLLPVFLDWRCYQPIAHSPMVWGSSIDLAPVPSRY
jgi:hypothetical protein